jgi:lactoylglutathione lyase
VGKGHGPVGLVTDDIAALFAKAVAAGATPTVPVFDAGGVQVAILLSPQGHEVELVQLPG